MELVCFIFFGGLCSVFLGDFLSSFWFSSTSFSFHRVRETGLIMQNVGEDNRKKITPLLIQFFNVQISFRVSTASIGSINWSRYTFFLNCSLFCMVYCVLNCGFRLLSAVGNVLIVVWFNKFVTVSRLLHPVRKLFSCVLFGFFLRG